MKKKNYFYDKVNLIKKHDTRLKIQEWKISHYFTYRIFILQLKCFLFGYISNGNGKKCFHFGYISNKIEYYVFIRETYPYLKMLSRS